ncbi:MAG TPA: hypothetical protein DHW82_06030 [Spirochaetia bacterium]|nr:MAG: hypothetical protein A2Y41_09690 [Spirochaetes bacterium GWB1_36_13]HCL56552.1 hypothetical protein [Spirochaetia bacterium]
MKKFYAFFLFLLFFTLQCSAPQKTKKTESVINLFNHEINGLQEDKLRQASDFFYNGSSSKSLEIYNDLLNSFMSADNQEAVVNTFFLIANNLTSQKRFNDALRVLQINGKRISLMFEPSKIKKYYKTLYMLEMSYLLLESNLASSEYTEGFLKHSLLMASELENNYLTMKAFKNLGVYHLNRFYLLSSEPGKDPQKTETDIKTSSLIEVGLSIEYLQKAFAIANKVRNLIILAQTAAFLGQAYSLLDNYNLAFENYTIAYKLYQVNSYFFQQALVLNQMGNLSRKTDDYLSALRYYKRAEEIISKNETIESEIKTPYLTQLRKNILELYQKLKDFEDLEKIYN